MGADSLISEIVLLILLLVLNGFFSLVETALVSANEKTVKMMAEDGNEKAAYVLNNIENNQKILVSVRVYIYVTLLFACALAVKLFAEPAGNAIMMRFGLKYSLLAGKIITVAVFALFALLLCELIPKRMGVRHSESVLLKMSKPIKYICAIITPIGFVLNGLANFGIRLMGVDPNEVDNEITEEEIRMLVDAGGDSGFIDESEKEMINNIFEFEDTMVGDIATHRTDIMALPITATADEVTDVVINGKFSRIPVYEENIDNIVGIFHIRDIVKAVVSSPESFKEKFKLSDVVMKPFFVPFSKKTDELFEEMQKNKIHMAIVIDEYGGTAGLVTMEDLLEEIVGNIFDEYDDVEEDIKPDGNEFLIKGTTSLKEVEELFDVELEDSEDYDTLGGYLIGRLGRIPNDREHPEVMVGGFTFKVLEIEDKRIELVRVIRN